MRQGFSSNRPSNNDRQSNGNSRGGFRPRGRGPFRGGPAPYRPPTQGQIDHLMALALEATTAETGFSKLPMESLLLGALKSETFDNPTPIQAEAIPIGLQGRDILGCAQTGTGKTLAFVIPLLNQLLQKPDAKALILVPTRELALQIEEVIKPLAKKINLGMPVLLIGGVSYHNQFRGLEEPHRIIVATPGRLIDHLGQETVNLSAVHSLVLDEADRMLDVGFKPQLTEILKYLPQERQTMMFTATLSQGVKSLSDKYLKSPAHLKVGETDRAHANITQKVMQMEASKKNDAMMELLKEHTGTVLVFVKTQIKTERIANILQDYGVIAAPIHGGLNQGQRKRALEAFRSEEIRVLVATDVAARGLDIDHVALVINYDLPQVIEDYVHRIGRTGRNGRVGVAVSLVAGEDRGLWRLIERKYISTDPKGSREPRSSEGGERRERSGSFGGGGFGGRRERSGGFGGGYSRDRSPGFGAGGGYRRRDDSAPAAPAEGGGYRRRDDATPAAREPRKEFAPRAARQDRDFSEAKPRFSDSKPRSSYEAREPRGEYRKKSSNEGASENPRFVPQGETRFTMKAKPREEGGRAEGRKFAPSAKPHSTGPFKGGKTRKPSRSSED